MLPARGMTAFCEMSIDNSRKHKNCFSSALGMLEITYHKNPFLTCLKSAVSNYTNGTQNDVL